MVLIRETTARLENMGITEASGPHRVPLSEIELPTVIKVRTTLCHVLLCISLPRQLFIQVAICGAFYPNYFIRARNAGQVDEKEAVKTLSGRDPYNTVYFTQFDPSQPGPLYAKRIKQLLQDCGTNMLVSFDASR